MKMIVTIFMIQAFCTICDNIYILYTQIMLLLVAQPNKKYI